MCTACGCLCDDILLTVASDQIVQAANACSLALTKLYATAEQDGLGPMATIDGSEVPLDEAIEEAAQLLAKSRAPLIYGLSRTTCEAQQAAVAIADWLGASIDSTSGSFPGLSGVTFQGIGEMTCTLGEVRHRGDVVIFWGANPAVTHPRLLSRYVLDPPGMFVPGGRADRHCIVIDSELTETAAAADTFLRIKPGCDFESLWVLRALIGGISLDTEQVAAVTGQPLSVWQELVGRMQQAHLGVIFLGGALATAPGKYLNAEAALALVRDLNSTTRFVCLPLREEANSCGADDVLLWTTGYPFAVNFAGGYPRYNPGEFSAAALLSRREVDAVLLIGVDANLEFDSAAREHLATIPVVSLHSQLAATTSGARVAFRTAAPGLNVPGTMYRLDDVPLPLRPTVSSRYPSDCDVLGRIDARVKTLRGYGPAAAVVHERSRLA